MGAPHRITSDKLWAKLEKVWREEGLNCVLLSERFGISQVKILTYLKDKYGSARAPLVDGRFRR